MRISKVLATLLLGFAVVEAANSDQSQAGQDSKEVSADNNGGAGNANQKQAGGGNENNQAGDNGNQQQGEGQQGEGQQQGNGQKGQQGQGQENQQGGKKGDGQQNQEQQNQNEKGGNQGNKNGGDKNNGANGQGAEQNVTQGLQPLPGAAEAAASLQPLPGLASLPPGAQQSLIPLGGSQPPAPPASLQPLGGGVQANASAPPPPGTASSTIDLAQLTEIANSVNSGAPPPAAATPGSFANGTHPAAATPQSGGLKQLPPPAGASAPPAGMPAATPAAFMTIPGGMMGGEGGEAPMATATPPAEILPGAVPPPQAANLEPLPGTISSDASLMALAPQTMTTMTYTIAGSDGSTVLATMTAPVNATAAPASRNATATAGSGAVQVAGASASRGSGTEGVVLVLSGVVGLLGYLMG